MLEQSSARLLHLQLLGESALTDRMLSNLAAAALVTCSFLWSFSRLNLHKVQFTLSVWVWLELVVSKAFFTPYRQDTNIQTPRKWNACFINLLFTSQHTSVYHHCSLPIYYGFLSDEEQITVLPLSGTKTIFTLKVIEKQSTGREISMYWLPLHDIYNVTPEETKKGFIRAALFGDNHSHLMVFAEHRICHKISEIDYKPSPLGWRNPIRLKNSEGCWKPISSNGVDYWIERI